MLSCRNPEETILYLSDESLEWLTEDDYNDQFTMVDNNGISQVFTMKSNRQYFIDSWSESFGVKRDIVSREYYSQKYLSDFGNEFCMHFQKGYEGEGDDLYFECADIGFGYDPQFNTLNRVNTYFGNLGQSFDSNGNYTYGLQSKIMILDHYSIGEKQYDGVMHFQLKDLKEKWDDKTVVEIYVAQGLGLIKYSLNGGVSYERE